MGKPLVTVIVVNYNSSSIWEIVRESIGSTLNLNYRPLEIILVDNGSTDGSQKLLRDLIRKPTRQKARVKFLQLPTNYGFAVANNIAFEHRNKRSKYVALINNDLAPEPDSLDQLVDYLEENPEVAGVQGKILSWDGKFIDSAGCYITPYMETYAVGHTLPATFCNKPIDVSYPSGAYSVYAVKAVVEAGGLFLPYFFMYGDDIELGIRLWRSGYKLKYLPITAGRHYGSATAKRVSGVIDYWSLRSRLSLMLMYNDYSPSLLLRLFTFSPLTLFKKIRMKAVIDYSRRIKIEKNYPCV
jgi:GT2 family glycosyltransferase